MESKPKKSRYKAFSILTFTILLLTFAYYFFIFVNNKKEAFNDKAFRIVVNVGGNIESKYQDYSKIVSNAFQDIVKYSNTNIKNKKPNDLREEFTKKQVPEAIHVKWLAYDTTTRESAFISSTIHPNDSIFTYDSIFIALSMNGIKSTVFYEFENLYKGILPREFIKNYIIFSEKKVYYSDVAAEKLHKVKMDSIFKKVKDGPQNLFHSTDVVEIEFNNESQLLYITPLNLGDSETIFLGGIIEKSYYHEQSFQLETNTVSTISVLLIILVLSIPFIKIILLSEDERLLMIDAVLSFLVIVLGSAFIILGLLAWYTESGPTTKEIEKYLKTYAQSIENNFLEEIDDVLSLIDDSDAQLINTKSRGYRSFNYDNANIDTSQFRSSYRYFNSIFWANKDGYQLAKWSTGEITPRVNLKFREYYSIPNDSKKILWAHGSLNNNPPGGFYIQSISSVTTGKRYAAISRKSNDFELSDLRITRDQAKQLADTAQQNAQDKKNPKLDTKPTVTILTTKLQSFYNLPIPSNIVYMIIDEKGKVLFHKNPAKVLQENIIEDMNYKKALTEAIFDKREVIFKSFYNESACRVLVKPIGELPLYMLIIKDEKVKKTSDAQVLGLSAMFYLLMFLIFFFQIGLFVIVDIGSNKKTKAQRVFFGWMWPNPSKKARYLYLIGYLFISLFIYLRGEMYDNVIITYAFFSLLITVIIFILRRFKKIEEVYTSAKYIAYYVVVLLIVFLLYYASFSGVDNFFSPSGFRRHPAHWYFIVFLFVSGLAVYYSFQIKKSSKSWKSPLIYNLFLFVFIMSLSTVPVFSFFTRAYNFEKLLYVQHTQYDLAKNIIQGGHLAKSEYNEYRDYKKTNKGYFKIVVDTVKPYECDVPHHFHVNEYNLISEIRFKMSNESNSSSVFQINNEQNKTMSWDICQDKIGLNYKYGTPSDNKVLKVVSDKLQMGPEEVMLLDKQHFGGIRFSMMVAFTLFALSLFLLVKYWSKSIYLLGIIPRMKPSVTKLVDNSDFIYLISQPYVGVSSFLKEKFDGIHQHIDTKFDLLEYKENKSCLLDIKIDRSKEVVVVSDNGKKDPIEIKKKIDLISQLKVEFYNQESAIKKIIFVSQLSPHQIMSFYRDKLDSIETKVLISEYFEILGDFVTTYFPMPDGNAEKQKNYQFIREELMAVPVYDYENDYWEYVKDSNLDEEDKLLNIQNKAQLYYFALWTSLEKREKFIIYDLAQDGLVNYRNINVIYNLLSRGIIKYRGGRLKLFNQSFANFVLTIIDKDQALEIEEGLKKSGKWASLRLPLFTLIGGVLVFIFLTQQQALSAFMGWATAAAALIPLLTRLIGVSWTGKGKTGI